MAKLTLSLGSNQGDRGEYLRQARAELTGRLGTVIFASDVVITPPWGPVLQPDFFNQILLIETERLLRGSDIARRLHGILDITQDIEQRCGRQRDQPWGPRTLDIDLIFADDIVYEDERISLPHPWWRQRAFVHELLPPGLADLHVPVFDQ